MDWRYLSQVPPCTKGSFRPVPVGRAVVLTILLRFVSLRGTIAVGLPQPMLTTANPHLGVCLTLTRAISGSHNVEQIFDAVLDSLEAGLQVSRASILLFDATGVMRFVASRGISDEYRAAVEGHSPWTPESSDAVPIIVGDVREDPSLAALLPT